MKKPRGKPQKENVKQEKIMNDESKPDWDVVGWISKTKSEKTYTITGIDDETGESFLIGFVRKETLAKLTDGNINGVPIKTPPNVEN